MGIGHFLLSTADEFHMMLVYILLLIYNVKILYNA